MGKIKKILENELTGGTQSTEVYPVTSIKAVYDENNERLDNIINRKDNEIKEELEAEVARATNAESNLRETINNITEINENATSANIVTVDTIPNTSSSNVQQALNELFKNALYAGIATPTTNPGTPNGPVFYLATKAGTYSNFDNISVVDGEAVILQWNNGAWTKKTTRLATEQETIYDVSARNDGAVFESLQALLSSSNLSTLIPASVRRGGMTIRFIQGSVPNSDNKYVQWRYMSTSITNADFVNVVNWQGVDDEPTAISANLVKSGGVAKQYGTYIDNENYIYAKLDSKGKVLYAIDGKGNVIFGTGIPPQIKQAIDELKKVSGHYINSSKYIKVVTDSDSKILQCFNSKGVAAFPAGIESPTIDSLKGNILNGKKYAFCGDSFTAAIFSNITDSEGRTGIDSPELYDSVRQMWKSYGWWVIDRNNMKYYADGVGGSRMTAVYDGGVIQNPNAFCNKRYMAVPKDSDYITLMFGLNETNVAIGDESSKDDSTLWGAYNKVLEYFLTEMPYAKIGIIISDAWMVGTDIATATKNIAKHWGIPYLDLGGDDRVPMRIGGKSYPVSKIAKSLRNAAFQISSSDSHPNQYGHKYMGSIVENFLRTL